MAQVGSFVPASRARIGVADKMFSRVGASDNLAAGRSTFMVEMLETAAILNQATERSLVILDEVGRGTSTHDGLSIAQACMEHLHDVVRCRTLFATHFHELADVSGRHASGRFAWPWMQRIGAAWGGVHLPDRPWPGRTVAWAEGGGDGGLAGPVLARATELLAGYMSTAHSNEAS